MAIELRNATPLYLQIVDDIKSQISSKKLKPGDKLGSHAELANQYNVSIITVKKALATMIYEGTAYSRVGKGTYVAKPIAQSSQHGQQTIGLILRDIRSPFFSRIMHSVEDSAYKMGYQVLISNSSGKAEREEVQIARARRFGVDGMIIASMTHNYQATPTIRKLLHEKYPFVMVSYIADESIPFVGTDHELGGYIATKHLLKLGYKKIAYINGEKGNEVGELRRKGYEQALSEYDRELDKKLTYRLRLRGEWYDYQSGYEIGKQYKKLSAKPDAFFIYNDLAALGFEDAILEQGLKIPDDVAIVGFDDIERGHYATVPLTTIRQPTDIIGTQAVEMLVKKMEGKNGTVRRILKPELVIRRSCGGIQKSPQRRTQR